MLFASKKVEEDQQLAIVGMGCRLPGGVDSPEALWTFLCRGGDATAEVPADRWNVEAYYDQHGSPGSTITRRGTDRHHP